MSRQLQSLSSVSWISFEGELLEVQTIFRKDVPPALNVIVHSRQKLILEAATYSRWEFLSASCMNREHYCKSPFFHCYLESARAPAKVSTYTMCYFLNIQHFNILLLFLLTTLKTIVIFLVGCLHGFSKSTWISLRTQAKVFPFVKIYISYISGESISVSRNLYFTSESVSLLILKYTCSATSLMRNVPQSQIIVSWNREVVKSSKTFVIHWISIDASEMPKVATMIFLTFI